MSNNKTPGLVGTYIRKKREAIGLSQRELGLKFNPPVTTQFISNIERGVTPLPPVHIPTLTQALSISNDELLLLLEKEYTVIINGRLSTDPNGAPRKVFEHAKIVEVWEAFQKATPDLQDQFKDLCEKLFQIPKASWKS